MESQSKYFIWSGMNKQGSRVKGILHALDLQAAEDELHSMGIDIIKVVEKPTPFLAWKKFKVTAKELIQFTRNLATMLQAGLPILKALEIIGKDQENVAFRSVIFTVQSDIKSGSNLADSFEKYPTIFDELYVNLVRAGEKTAMLEKVLKQLVNYLEKSDKLKRKVKHALIYPIAIISVSIIVSFILLLFVIPQFKSMFEAAGVPLPIFTRFVLHLSTLVKSTWYILATFLFLAFFSIKILRKRSPYVAEKWDRFVLKIYVLGNVIQKAIIARFTRTLAVTLDAGLPIVDAMHAMVNIMGNKVYSKAITKVCHDLTSGNQLASSLMMTELFPNMVIQMISIGEESGRLGEMLGHIANYYEEEVDIAADNLAVMLEPLIIVILGVVIGSFIIAMYLPIFKIGSTIG